MAAKCIAFVVAHKMLSGGAPSSCKPLCGPDCTGYGTLDSGDCGICTIYPESDRKVVDDATFVTWYPQTNDNGGCHGKVCLACPTKRDVRVTSHTHLFLSSSCTSYVPLPAGAHGAHVNIASGARNVVVIGPGTITSDQWPLELGAPTYLKNVTFALPPGETSNAAVRVSTSGQVQIIAAQAPNFRALVSVYGEHARPLDLHRGSEISGGARDALVGLGHVSGHVTATCTNHSNSVVIQELVGAPHRRMTFTNCNVVNLTKLLGFYGTEYEQMFFDDYNKDLPPWRGVRRAATAAVILGLATFLGYQHTIEEHEKGD